MSASIVRPASVVTANGPSVTGGLSGSPVSLLLEDELDAAVLELAADLVPELLLVGARQDLLLGLEDRDLLLGPAGADLAGELEPGRSGARDQDAVRASELLVALPVAADRECGVVGTALGGIGIGSNSVASTTKSGLSTVPDAKRPTRPASTCTAAVTHDSAAVGEQVVVGE